MGFADHQFKKGKYNAKKTEVDGIKFDSKREAERYVVLKGQLDRGEIQKLELQPKFPLVPTFKKDGQTFRGIKYKADFMYQKNGVVIIEDVKGFATKEYKLKRKLFEWIYPNLTITEVR